MSDRIALVDACFSRARPIGRSRRARLARRLIRVKLRVVESGSEISHILGQAVTLLGASVLVLLSHHRVTVFPWGELSSRPRHEVRRGRVTDVLRRAPRDR